MAKVAYIIPGLGETIRSKGYAQISKSFKSNGYIVIPIKISWKYKTMTDYIEEFLTQQKHAPDDDVTIFGFSFGAFIAYCSAPQIKPQRLILASLSPYFKEDLKTLRRSWKAFMGKHRIADFRNYSFDRLSKQIQNCDITLLSGEFESYELIHRVTDAHKKLKNSTWITLEKTKHDISQKKYIETLKDII